MRERKQGLTLAQKITQHLNKIKKKNVISHLGESFFQPVEEQGLAFMLRRTNLQRENGRTMNIVDEIQVQQAKARAEQAAEEAKDMTFDNFKSSFLAHIEGTAPNERETIDSGDEAEDQKKSLNPLSKRGTDPNRTSSHFAGDNDSVENDKKS